MRFFLYSRKSVCTETGDSVGNQITLCKDYLRAHFADWDAAQLCLYEDEGFSAKTVNRPQFQVMLADLRREPPDYVVCYRLDRISRSVSDFSALIEELGRLGVAFLSIREEFDTARPMGKAMMYMASVFAQLERETIAQRVRDNMCLLARTGCWLGGTTPTGYVSEPCEELRPDGKRRTACRLAEHPAELCIVDRIFAGYRASKSVTGVCRALMRAGIRSRTGSFFSLPGIRNILQNPVYCTADADALAFFREKGAEVCVSASECGKGLGLIAYQKRGGAHPPAARREIREWIVAVGQHRGRIPGTVWVEVQESLLQGAQTSALHPHNEYALLSGMLRCGLCGARMFAKRRSRNPAHYDYLCANKLKGGCAVCALPNLDGAHTDALLWQALCARLPSAEPAAKTLSPLRRALLQRCGGESCVDGRKKACQAQMDRLTQALCLRDASPAFVRQVSERLSALEAELCALDDAESPAPCAPPDDLLALVCDDAWLTALTAAERRRIVRRLLGELWWDGVTLCVKAAAP